MLRAAIGHRLVTLGCVGALTCVAAVLFMFIGTDYFPQVDAGQMTLHVRAPAGTRIEEAERLFQGVEQTIREVLLPKAVGTIIDNIGLPASNYNFAFGNGTFVAYYDGEVLITLKPGAGSAIQYQKQLRPILRANFPSSTFYFEPADMITQILDFGTPAQIDVQVSGRHPGKDLQVAEQIRRQMLGIRGVVDTHIQQITNAPEFFVNVDRERAAELGLTEQQVANNLNVSLSGSFQVSPNFWSDPKTGIPYQVWVQTPQYRNDSLEALENTPLLVAAENPGQPAAPQLLSNVATMQRAASRRWPRT